VLVLLSEFAVANSVLRRAAQRRLSQVRAASAEAQVGGDVIEVIADEANPRWLVGDTRGEGLPAVRLVFFTDGLLEARDRAGRFFRLDQQIETLRRPDLQAAADELLDRLRAHSRHRLDDVAVLLAELPLTDPASLHSAAAGHRSVMPRQAGRGRSPGR
jgi:hypothetical protein